jgi:DNA helicase IV
MKVLKNVPPTPEQLPIIHRNDPGVTIIRGSAGSGKTTTALLRIKFLAAAWTTRHRRLGIDRPVKMLVLTYNKTLRGYIKELTDQQVPDEATVELDVKTFAKWAYDELGGTILINTKERTAKLYSLAAGFKNTRFIIEEVDYAMGKFLPKDIGEYIECERVGRGVSPRCDKSLRQTIIDDIIEPYTEWKNERRELDFNDLAVRLFNVSEPINVYDVVVIDEAQDFSANEVRAITKQLADDHSITFVLDAAQSIYAKNFTWREVGLTAKGSQIFKLSKNYRNTSEIAAFVSPVLVGVDIGGDEGAIPNFENCSKHGPLPNVIIGTYLQQLDWSISYLRENVDLENESVAFLKPLGGNWFKTLRGRLLKEDLEFVELTRKSDWPGGTENIAVCTMHSAKGLEFDHVIVLGLNDEMTPHGMEPGDVQLDTLRRLLVMALGRARTSIVIGYKELEASSLVRYFKEGTFNEVRL